MNNKQSNEQQWKLLVLLLKNIAGQKGISHRDIAKRTGLHKSNVTRIFSLKYSPTLKTFLNVAKAIGVNFFFKDQDGQRD